MKLLELAADLAVIPCGGMVLKRADENCVLFMPGASPVDGGFLIERDYDEVIDELEQALEGDDGDEAR